MITENGKVGWKSEVVPEVLAGFAHGNSGFIELFSRLYEVYPQTKYLDILSSLVEYENSLYSEKDNNWIDLRKFSEVDQHKSQPIAWCHGAAGILLSRLTLYNAIKNLGETALLQQAIKDISLAKNKLIEDGLHAGFCLCHGNMGNLLILKRYAEIFDDKQVRSICDSRFEQILEFLNEENILPTELYNPGFMTGLSGIAYALLKYKMPKLPLLTAGFIYCIYREKYWVFEFVNRIKKPIQQLVYVFLMLLSSYAYICFSLLIKADFNAVICAVLLLLLIWAMDYLFSLCFKKNDLGISEKKRYIFMAYVGACISGFIIASRDASKMALEIPNITISVLIGAYVPFTLLLEDGKKGKVELQSMKEEWEEKYKKTFRERKVKDILSALLFAMVYGVLLVGALSPAQNIINDIASGIGMGMATVVVAFVGLVEVKNRLTKRRNKREDADQEKSDTE